MKTTHNTEPLVAVVIPNYNNGPFLRDALESMLAQTYNNFEIIAIDDCSTDDSWNILQEYVQKDSRVAVYKNETNLGIYTTRNRLLEKVSPDAMYIAILDADDVAKSDRLEKQARFLEVHPEYGVVGSSLDLIDEHGAHLGARSYPTKHHDIQKSLLCINPIAQPAAMLRVSAMKEVGQYDESLPRAGDHDYWVRFALKNWKLGNIEEPLTAYRIHAEQGKYKNHRAHLLSGFKVRARYVWRRRLFSFKALAIMSMYFCAAWLPNWLVAWVYQKKFT